MTGHPVHIVGWMQRAGVGGYPSPGQQAGHRPTGECAFHCFPIHNVLID